MNIKEILEELIQDSLHDEAQKKKVIDWISEDIRVSKWRYVYEQLSIVFSNGACEETAVSLQLLFAFTNIIDDIADADMQSNHQLTSSQLVILSQMGILKAVSLMPSYVQPGVMKRLLRSGAGEMKDLSFNFHNKLWSEDDYYEMVAVKSGCMMEIIGYVSDPEQKALHQFMNRLGIANQIKNDMQDVLNPLKSDFDEFKMYLPLIKYIEYSGDKTLQHVSRTAIQRSGALEYSKLMYNNYIEIAYQELSQSYPDKSREIELLKNEINF